MATVVRPGEVLAGKYRIERVLGQGGMGYVVAARHLQLDQLVAMKFLRHGALDETEAVQRFLREAKAAVKLRNEHVAKVFDVGTLESGEPYMVMEYLDGSDLSAIAKERGRLEVNESVDYIIQACEALAEAHSLNIIHRDIKLANLFVTRGPAGQPLVKVLDFGISKTNPFGESEHDVTRTASMLGSPRFMSPEQMRDPRAVDGRSDIWSLGVVLYRIVAGRPPFEADTLGRLLTMVMHEIPPPLSSARPDLPPGFEETVMRALEKDPSVRYSNVAELAYAIAPFATDPVRARAACDRIAATLSVAAMPRSVSIPISISSQRISSPPGASDTGTAAPWAGTGSKPMPQQKTNVIGAAVAAFALLILMGIAVKTALSNAKDKVANAAGRATTTMTANPEPPTPVQAQPQTMQPNVQTAPQAPATTAVSAEKKPDPAPKRPQPAWNPSKKPVTTPAGGGGGIPATRD